MAPCAFQCCCCTWWVFLPAITCHCCQSIDFTCGQFGIIKDFFACSSSGFPLKNQQVWSVVSWPTGKVTASQLLQLASSPCLHLTDWALHFLSDCVWLPFTLSLFSLFFCLSWWCLTLINTTTTTTINWIDAPLWVPVICIYLIRLFNHTRTGHCVLCQGKSRSNCMPLHLLCVLNRLTSLSGAVFLK